MGAAPSNVAADNLARRLLKTTTLDVKRYGPPGKITDADVRRISSQQMAIAADGDWRINSKKRGSGGGNGRAKNLPRKLML